ncbi:peptidylprolyl isomerase [Asticcacaulis sp. EMRT-3]|uniref:peptidylprolyl isomerase n=1 Tax=Asticcacaulis sp. EMRT-3 TaxID=3040349 RepID=UPI0024AF7F83|nr:peptidylprolyl isomerase [Asticcacaulis sp. EMRT-3]MDI7774346.1 peptidylprolyl isomerase [Asticcacaulis sp. EMRT-3]
MSVVKKKAILAGAVVAFFAAGICGSALALDPGYRAPDADNTVVIDTTKGEIIVELYPALAPLSVERIKTLTRQHFYDGLTFHRVIEDFMDQTGDPKGDGTGGSTLPDVKAEFTIRHDASFPMVVAARPTGSQIGFLGAMPVASQVNELMPMSADGKVEAWPLFCQGVMGMAHSYDPNTNNSQFFLMRGSNSSLDKNYTAVGVVLSGMEAVRKMKIGEPPVDPDKVTKMRMLSDIPEAERPQIEVMDTSSPQFQAVIDQTRKDKGADFSACDVPMPFKDLKAKPADAAPAAAPAAIAPASPLAPASAGN